MKVWVLCIFFVAGTSICLGICRFPPSLWCSSTEIAEECQEKKDGSSWEFKCQHGEEECIGNIIETCTIYLTRNISVYFPFIHCIETTKGHIENATQKCASKFKGIDLDKIMGCSKSSLGNELEHQMALLTEALQPPHTYVPWVTLNGVHTDDIQDMAENDLVNLICQTYQGPKPAGCQKEENNLMHSCLRI
ncbi:hypothetical protein ACJMK2_004518 [Sinanodonta woodiana]|uniref:Gamma-interferon-inducible lysosomal thiol reductase n=1 Tax=Sinanodonta woodiana TaxID=1069815 RepID=A0ABD3Y2L9_SINWO